ncbi:MAG: hypothetical protein KAJ34_08195, partial [Thermodesulfovibrionia bacterium]|nr:hypothetical protein [Thermodesulfovibrionia bacterium]
MKKRSRLINKKILLPSDITQFYQILLKSLLLFVILFLSFSDVIALDDQCPEIWTSGGESVQAIITDKNTGKPVTNGTIVPPGTWLNLDVLATAYGSCETWDWHPFTGCYLVMTEERAVDHIQLDLYAESETSLNGWYRRFANIWGVNDANYPIPLQVLDSRAENTTGTITTAILYPGIYTYYFINVISATTCQILPNWVVDTVTVYGRDENDKDLGDTCDSSDNAAKRDSNGNNYLVETDFTDTGTELPFMRHYNSQLDIDVGLGHGWTTTHHKRLEKYADTIWASRADGHAERFTNSGSDWQSDPDSQLSLIEDASG